MRESLEKMLAKGVDNPLLRFGLGKAWLDEGNGAQAAVHLSACVKQDPKYSAAWKLLGKAYQKRCPAAPRCSPGYRRGSGSAPGSSR